MFKFISFFNKFENIDIKNFTTINYLLPTDITSENIDLLISTIMQNVYDKEIKNIFNNKLPLTNNRFNIDDFKLSINWLYSDIFNIKNAYESLMFSESQKNFLIKSFINKFKNVLNKIKKNIEIIETKQLYEMHIDNISLFDYSNIEPQYNKYVSIDPNSNNIITNQCYINEKDNTIELATKTLGNLDFTYLNYIKQETTSSLINTIDISKINNDGMNSYIYTSNPVTNGAVLTLNFEFRNKVEINNITITMNPKYIYSKIEIYNINQITNQRQLIYIDTNITSDNIYSIMFDTIETNNLIIKIYQTTCDAIMESDLTENNINRDEIEYAIMNNIKSIMLNKIKQTENKLIYAYNFNIKNITIEHSSHKSESIVMFKKQVFNDLKSVTILPNHKIDKFQDIEYYIYKIDYNEFGNIIRSITIPILPYLQNNIVNERLFLIYNDQLAIDKENVNHIGKLRFKSFNDDLVNVYENNILLTENEYEIIGNEYIRINNPKFGAIYTVSYTPFHTSLLTPSDIDYLDIDKTIYIDNTNTIYFKKQLLSDTIYKSDIYLFAMLRNNNQFNSRSPKIYNIKMITTHWGE